LDKKTGDINLQGKTFDFDRINVENDEDLREQEKSGFIKPGNESISLRLKRRT
jgi:hypothetical protein